MRPKIKKKLTVIISCSLLLIGNAELSLAADMDFRPYIVISEEFNDNIYETSSNKQHELITRLQPGFTFRYQAPFWNWDMGYNFDYQKFAQNSRSDQYNHNANLNGTVTLLDNFFHLDLSDTYNLVNLDIAHNVSTESSLFLNQTEQNIATISPYLLWRLSGDSTLKTGYRYVDTRYWGGGIERNEHGAYADLNHELTSKLSLSAGYAFTYLESQSSNYNKHDLYGGFKYQYSDKSFVYGKAGNSWQQFKNGGNSSYLFWNAGATHDMGFAVATIETKVQTVTDPLAVSTKETSYSGKLEKTLHRGLVALSAGYSEFVNSETGSGKRQSLNFNTSGRYEILQSLTANITATFEKFSRLTNADYPYRLSGVVGLNYALQNDFTIGLTYTYVNYLFDLDTTAGSKQINKAVLDIKKIF